jgi:hypothetical protein
MIPLDEHVEITEVACVLRLTTSDDASVDSAVKTCNMTFKMSAMPGAKALLALVSSGSIATAKECYAEILETLPFILKASLDAGKQPNISDMLHRASNAHNAMIAIVSGCVGRYVDRPLSLHLVLDELAQAMKGGHVPTGFPALVLVGEAVRAFSNVTEGHMSASGNGHSESLSEETLSYLSAHVDFTLPPHWESSIPVDQKDQTEYHLKLLSEHTAAIAALHYFLHADVDASFMPSYTAAMKVIPALASVKGYDINRRMYFNDVRRDWRLWDRLISEEEEIRRMSIWKLHLGPLRDVHTSSAHAYTVEILAETLNILGSKVALYAHSCGFDLIANTPTTVSGAVTPSIGEIPSELGTQRDSNGSEEVFRALSNAQEIFGTAADASLALVLEEQSMRRKLEDFRRGEVKASGRDLLPLNAVWSDDEAFEILDRYPQLSVGVVNGASGGDEAKVISELDDSAYHLEYIAEKSLKKSDEYLDKPVGIAVLESKMFVIDNANGNFVQRDSDNAIILGQSSTQLLRPRSAVLFPMGGKKLLYIMSDTSHHILKAFEVGEKHGVKLSSDGGAALIHLAGTGSAGKDNRPQAKKSSFSFPAGLAVYEPPAHAPKGCSRTMLVVCDSMNHCLRSLQLNARTGEWEVDCLVGTMGKQGQQDGSHNEALLRSPQYVCVNSLTGDLYISTQGKDSISIRKYNLFTQSMSTLHVGEPIKTAGDMCIGDDGVILLTDGAANTVWAVDPDTGSVSPFLTQQEAFESMKYKVSKEEFKDKKFIPLCVRVASKGCYLITDGCEGRTYRYFKRDGIPLAIKYHLAKYTQTRQFQAAYNWAVDEFVRVHLAANSALKRAVVSLMQTKHAACVRAYEKQASDLLIACRQITLPTPTQDTQIALQIFIRNAPSMRTLAAFLTGVESTHIMTENTDLCAKCRNALIHYLSEYDYSLSHYLSFHDEIGALCQILRANVLQANLQECVCLVLKNEK